MWTDRSRRLFFYAGAFFILLFALSLRIYGQNWDDGWYLQPDERNIVMVLTDRIHAPRFHDLGALLNPERSPLNPRSDDDNGKPQSYAYGSLPLYVTDFVAWIAGVVTRSDQNNYDHVGIVGRNLTAIFDAATVALAMIFARRAIGRLAALLAGMLLAATVLMVQLAHFFAVDPWVTFFSTALLLACLCLHQRPGYRWSLLAGVCFGLALTTQISVF